jgi:hypothetical protein
MKKIFIHIIIFVLAFIPTYMSAQVESPLIGAEWHYTSSSVEPLDNFYLYRVEKDTTINGKIGKKINRITSNNQVLGYEILYLENDRVYYWFENDFHLMYDFAAEIGDTVIFSFKSYALTFPFADTTLEVSGKILEKSQVSVNGELLMRVKSSIIPSAGLENEYIWPGEFIYTEQIGHDYLEMDIIYKIPLPSTMSGSRLRCYNNNINFSYITPFWDIHGNGSACDYLLSTNTIDTKQYIAVFPNPVKDVLSLTVANTLHIQQIELFDLNGRHVKTYKANERELSLKGLPPGQYLLELNTDKGKVTKKVIVE